MFCENCGAELSGSAKFCPECGRKVVFREAVTQQAPNPPIGIYQGNLCEVEMMNTSLIIRKKVVGKRLETTIPYQEIRKVFVKKAGALSSGYRSIIAKDNAYQPCATGFTAPSDPYSCNFVSKTANDFYKIYDFLDGVARRNAYPDGMEIKQTAGEPVDPQHAIKICLNCGDKLLEKAIRCPTCGANAKGFPVVDKDDGKTIAALVANAPNASQKEAPRWKEVTVQAQPVKAQASEENRTLSKRERIKENKKNAVACCPKCGSTSLSANKKGFGVGKAVVGAAIVGPIGLVAGNKGAKKVYVTCLNCGHRWKI